jgi:RNA polymerase sigma-70 factor (ECF subfamily)
VAQTLAGDSDGFRALVERHSSPVFRLAYRMTGNQQDAEDVVQESFLRAYRQLRQFDQRASFGTWLYRITANCSLDLIRSRNRRGTPPDEKGPEIPSGHPGPERLVLSGEIRDRVTRALETLSDAERTAFVLRHYEGLGIEEIGRILGVQAGAAKHSVFRAVQKLRQALEPMTRAAR